MTRRRSWTRKCPYISFPISRPLLSNIKQKYKSSTKEDEQAGLKYIRFCIQLLILLLLNGQEFPSLNVLSFHHSTQNINPHNNKDIPQKQSNPTQHKTMLSSLRSYSRNIEKSERFYYDNYEYYNIYENLQKDYKDDLGKFIYHCSRRTTPYIVTYGSMLRFKYSRLTRLGQPYRTMEDFVNEFIGIYMENNYFVPSKAFERDGSLQPVHLLHFSPISDLKYLHCPFKMFLLQQKDLTNCILMLINTYKLKIQKLEQQYMEDQEHVALSLPTVEFHYAMELYSDRVLSQNYLEENSQSFLLLFEFVVEVHRLMWELLNARIRTILLMAQPKTYFMNLVIHPLVLPITTFLKYAHMAMQKTAAAQASSLYKLVAMAEEKKPRIVFLNLDGRETAHNLRSISTLGEQILYISLFEEPSWLDKKDTTMANIFNSDDETFEPTYSRLWDILSQVLIKQFKEVTDTSVAKFLLFPLNSSYIYRSYLRQCYEADPTSLPSHHSAHMPRLSTSNQIHTLFETIIYEQIRAYKPTMIFISYNGQLNIVEEHFADIVRNCSVASDHRVVLFANFTHFFQEEPLVVSEEEEHSEKVLCVHEIYQRYQDYRYEDINQERLYGNLSLFLKFAPGIYSMEDRVFGTPSMKYNLSHFYQYLEILTKMQQFKFLQKYRLNKWSSQQLCQLYKSYLSWQIKENKKQNKYYENLLAVVVAELLCKNITEGQLEALLGKRLFYRFRFLVEELVREEMEVRAIVGMGGDDGMADSRQEVMRLLEDYLEAEKEKLLAENFENYKTKKYFYLPENQKSFGQVSCLKFVLTNYSKQTEQIYLQKYTQIIINEEYQQLFMINYKAPDNRHLILSASIKNSQIQKQVPVSEVLETEQEQNEEMNTSLEQVYLSEEGQLSQKQDILFVQYNYCISDRTLYLFWPLLWNLKEEARCKLLGVEYRPNRVWKMIKVFQYQYNEFRFENVRYDGGDMGIEVLPRWGCTCYPISAKSFHIFGGVYDSEDDFKKISSGVHIAQIKEAGKYRSFSIKAVPKSQNKTILACLRPKINYTVRSVAQKTTNQQNCLKLTGGYGRESTSFFNIFSYDEYLLAGMLYPQRIFDGKISRRIVTTEKPIECNKIGKFNVILNNYNVTQIEEKFSDGLKDKFVFEKRVQSGNKTNEWQLMSFIDESYRVNEFKTDPKKLFLFGFDRTIREKIFLRCWSPQLYFVDGVKDYIVNLSLKTEKTSSYVITNYLMPREQDIISLCLEEDKLYLLSNSPIIHSIDRTGIKFVFYEGSLANMNEVIRKKEIQMITKHNFEERCEKFLYDKTIFVHDEKVYLVGGLSVQIDGMETKWEREDYIMETGKNRFKIKTRKIDSTQTNLQMPNSVAIKQNEHYLLYSIAFEDNPSPVDTKEGIEWKLKIQRSSYENSEPSYVRAGALQTYAHNPENPNKIQRYEHANIDQPKLVRILPYRRFNLAAVREVISKIMWRIEKNQLGEQQKYEDMQSIRRFHNQTDDRQLIKMLQKEWNGYEEIFASIKKRAEVAAQINQAEQQLLLDLKYLYEMVTRLILQKYLCLQQQAHPNEHIFLVQDKSSRKVKYIAVGPLNTTRLNFFRIRFRHQLSIILNQHTNEALFYHPTVAAYYKFEEEKLRVGNSTVYGTEEVLRGMKVVVKQ